MSEEVPKPTANEQRRVNEAIHVIDECAKAVARDWPRWVNDPAELRAIGTFALYKAANRYRPEMNAEFVKYARCRVRHAMIDVLRTQARHAGRERSLESLTPGARRASVAGAMVAAGDRMAAEYAPTGFDALHNDANDMRGHLQDFASRLFAAAFSAGVDEVLKHDDAEAAELREEYANAIACLGRALRKLRREESDVISLVYGSGMTLDEASERLGIAYSTARERHQRGLSRLHTLLDAFGVTRAPAPMDVPSAPSAGVLPANDGGSG